MTIHTYQSEVLLPRPIEEVFAFFSNALNLDRITPPWLKFEVLTPEVPLQTGALIDYQLRWRWLPIRWRTEITAWDPPHRFIDQQRRGPYQQWIHCHTFETRDGGTWMQDRVDYAVPGWFLEPLVHRLLVGPDVEAIFAYRRKVFLELFKP